MGSILALNHKFFNASKSTGETKGSPLWVFFATMRLFSKIFEIYQSVPPCIFLKFSVCRKRWMSLNGLFLSFSALCDLKNTFFKKKFKNNFFWKKNFFQIFPIVVPWIFLSLRYGADLGRSRLVLFFVRLFTHRVCTTFCELFTFTKSTQYLILNVSKGLYLEMQNPEGSPLPIFRRYDTFPRPFFGFVRLFFEIF